MTNIDDEAEDLAVYCQAYIYESSSFLPISCLDLKATQPCQALNCYRSRLLANHLFGTQGYPLSFESFQNYSRHNHRQV